LRPQKVAAEVNSLHEAESAASGQSPRLTPHSSASFNGGPVPEVDGAGASRGAIRGKDKAQWKGLDRVAAERAAAERERAARLQVNSLCP